MDSTLEGLILHAQAFRKATSHSIQIAATEPAPGGKYKLPAFPPNYVTLTQKLADDTKSKDITWEGQDDEYCYACRILLRLQRGRGHVLLLLLPQRLVQKLLQFI